MTVYVVLYLVLFALLVVEKKIDSGKKIAFVIASLSLICIVGLRKECMGIDLPGYLHSFDYLSRLSLSDAFQIDHFRNYEKGYIFFNALFGVFSSNEHAFLFSCVLLSFMPIAIFAYKNSPKFSLSIIVYLALPPFLLLFSGLRQSLAIGLCLLSFEFIKKRNFALFSILVVLAMSFHSSAILFFIAYPLYAIKLDMKGRWMSVFCLALVYVVKVPVYFILARLLKESPSIDNNGAVLLMVFFLLIYIFCFFYSRQTKHENGLLNIFWVACFCQIFGSLNFIAIRAGYYFMLALVPLLPLVLDDVDDMYEKVNLKIVVLTCFVIAGIFFIYNGSWAQAYPHYWFWE